MNADKTKSRVIARKIDKLILVIEERLLELENGTKAGDTRSDQCDIIKPGQSGNSKPI